MMSEYVDSKKDNVDFHPEKNIQVAWMTKLDGEERKGYPADAVVEIKD